MWQVIYIADSSREAGRIREVLHGEGILVRERGIEGSGHYQILVPSSEVEEAVEAISRRQLN